MASYMYLTLRYKVGRSIELPHINLWLYISKFALRTVEFEIQVLTSRNLLEANIHDSILLKARVQSIIQQWLEKGS